MGSLARPGKKFGALSATARFPDRVKRAKRSGPRGLLNGLAVFHKGPIGQLARRPVFP